METDCNQIRVELFKLNYVKGEFQLHDKGDAFEAMNFILTQMHTWMQFATSKRTRELQALLDQPYVADITHKLEKLAEIRCSHEEGNACMIHNKVFID